ncbi:MAG TPA: TPM domain-containing protein [Sphingomicrobium sp.]|nr:TPM domain-containing protein [Sphingomicrobium sp.]
MAIQTRLRDCFAALALTLLFCLAAPAFAQTFPQLTGRVVDQAGLLRPEQSAQLESRLAALEVQTGRQLVVATVNSLEGRTIEDYGYRLGREWGIGREGEDDGVILLVAPNEKKVRIETGYGARVFLTDAVSSVIIRNAILPRFKAGDMAGGIEAGADEIIKQMSLPAEEAARNVARAEEAQEARRDDGPSFVPLLFWGMVALFVLMSMGRRSFGRRYRAQGKRRRGRGRFDSGDLAILLWGLDAPSRRRRGRGENRRRDRRRRDAGERRLSRRRAPLGAVGADWHACDLRRLS